MAPDKVPSPYRVSDVSQKFVTDKLVRLVLHNIKVENDSGFGHAPKIFTRY